MSARALVAAIDAEIAEHEREAERHVRAIGRLSDMKAELQAMADEDTPPAPPKPPAAAEPAGPKKPAGRVQAAVMDAMEQGPATMPEIAERCPDQRRGGLESATRTLWNQGYLVSPGKVPRHDGPPARVFALPDWEGEIPGLFSETPRQAEPAGEGNGGGPVLSRTDEAVKAVLAGGPGDPDEIAPRIKGQTAASVATACAVLAAAGEIRKRGDGRYELVA